MMQWLILSVVGLETAYGSGTSSSCLTRRELWTNVQVANNDGDMRWYFLAVLILFRTIRFFYILYLISYNIYVRKMGRLQCVSMILYAFFLNLLSIVCTFFNKWKLRNNFSFNWLELIELLMVLNNSIYSRVHWGLLRRNSRLLSLSVKLAIIGLVHLNIVKGFAYIYEYLYFLIVVIDSHNSLIIIFYMEIIFSKILL